MEEKLIGLKIWNSIGDFLTEVALENDTDNSITSIDSLRQLATIYLQKDENTGFHFLLILILQIDLLI